MKRTYKLLISLGITIGLVACTNKPTSNGKDRAAIKDSELVLTKPDPITNKKQVLVRDRLNEFITTKLKTKSGFYTNYQASHTVDELAAGHELLSESNGLYLRVLAVQGKSTEFQNFYRQTVKIFGQANQFSYRVTNGKPASVNATVDDLRILRSLYEYQSYHNSKRYRQEIKRLVRGLEDGSLAGGQLVDYYDPTTKSGSKQATLCYFDFKTLGQFETKTTLKAQLKLVQGGYLSDKFPFYRTRYDYQTKKYVDSSSINTTESMLTLLHLSEVGLLRSTSLKFVTNLVEKRQLVNKFSAKGKVLDDNQAIANYAIAYLIGVNENSAVLKTAAQKQLVNQQIVDQSSALYGGYGDSQTLATYSFNNLEVLLALNY